MTYNSSQPFDKYNCFHIQDFQKEDSVIVMIDDKRVKGRVTFVNESTNTIQWVDVESCTHDSSIEDFIYLAKFEPDWI